MGGIGWAGAGGLALRLEDRGLEPVGRLGPSRLMKVEVDDDESSAGDEADVPAPPDETVPPSVGVLERAGGPSPVGGSFPVETDQRRKNRSGMTATVWKRAVFVEPKQSELF